MRTVAEVQEMLDDVASYDPASMEQGISLAATADILKWVLDTDLKPVVGGTKDA